MVIQSEVQNLLQQLLVFQTRSFRRFRELFRLADVWIRIGLKEVRLAAARKSEVETRVTRQPKHPVNALAQVLELVLNSLRQVARAAARDAPLLLVVLVELNLPAGDLWHVLGHLVETQLPHGKCLEPKVS